MQITTKRITDKGILNLTAADLMSAPLTCIPDEMLLRDAGHLLRSTGISGAPVVDSSGTCIGILSSSDFVGWAEKGGEMESRRTAIGFIAPWGEIVDLEACEGCVVRRYMTEGPVTVSRTSAIGEIAQKMIDAHIHRVLVANGKRPCGIVSSTDIVAAVANAARNSAREKGG